MARHRKQGADWFSHDSNSRNDLPIKALLSQHGHTGYAVYFMLLEVLTGSPGFRIEYTEEKRLLLAGDFAVKESDLNGIVELCLKFKLLAKDGDFLQCPQLTADLKPLVDKRERMQNKYNNKKAQNSDSGNSAAETQISESESTHSIDIVQYSTVEYSTVEYKNINSLYSSFISSLSSAGAGDSENSNFEKKLGIQESKKTDEPNDKNFPPVPPAPPSSEEAGKGKGQGKVKHDTKAQPHPAHGMIKGWFAEEYNRRYGTAYDFKGAQDAVAINGLIEKIHSKHGELNQVPDADQVFDSFKVLIENSKDEWTIQSGLSMINRNFNRMFISLKSQIHVNTANSNLSAAGRLAEEAKANARARREERKRQGL